MITINATGDTTLHTAGKYCPEDILVKVPAGGSGGGGVETCTVNIDGSALSSSSFTMLSIGVLYAKTDGTIDYTETLSPISGLTKTYNIPKGFLVLYDNFMTGEYFHTICASGNIENIVHNGFDTAVYYVYGDCEIIFG